MQNRRREGHGGDDESYCHVKRASSEGAPRGLCGEIYKKSGSTTGEEFRVIGVGW